MTDNKLKAKKMVFGLAVICNLSFGICHLHAAWSTHVVISQFSTGSERSTKDEFIELYNPTGTDIDISEWRLQVKATGENKNWVTKSLVPADKKIQAYSFFLIANAEPNYSGLEADLTKDASFGLLSEEGSIRIIDYDGQEIDKVGYGLNSSEYEKAPVENDGASIARRNFGLDTDNNKSDFVAMQKRNPHNSFSIPEKPSDAQVTGAGARRPSSERLKETDREKELEGASLYREAKSDWRNNKLFDCIEKLKKVIEADPQNSSAQNDLQEIPKKIKEDLEKKNLVGRDQFYGEAVLYYIQNDYSPAAVNLKKILILTPEDSEVRQWYEKINALVPPRSAEEPVVSTPAAVTPKKPVEAVKIKHKPAGKKEEKSGPITPTGTSSKKDSDKAEEHYNNGLKEYSSGYVSKAIEEWEMCLKYSPNHERAKNALAKARKTIKK